MDCYHSLNPTVQSLIKLTALGIVISLSIWAINTTVWLGRDNCLILSLTKDSLIGEGMDKQSKEAGTAQGSSVFT